MKLTDPVGELPLIGPTYEKKLERLGILTIADLLYHVPSRYLDFSKTKKIKDIKIGEIVTIRGLVNSVKNQTTKRGSRMQIAQIEDESGKITVLWFNQPFLVRALHPGTQISLSGKVEWFAARPALISPEFEIVKTGSSTTHTGKITGVYHETAGVSSKWLRSRVKMALQKIDLSTLEFLPKKILSQYDLVKLDKALIDIHFPKKEESTKEAYKRLAFNELLFLHLNSLSKRKHWRQHTKSFKVRVDRSDMADFTSSLPFVLTASQERVADEIVTDFAKKYPMNRLLQGDVGSGKTIVAALAAYLVFKSGYKTVVMAPTQILANQHFNSLKQIFKGKGMTVELVTSGKKSKINQKTNIIVGTHALIHRSVEMDKVGLVVIDEQHKFGVEQRRHLLKNKSVAHVLTMTATPIPRTIALTLYGDQDLSVLTDMPLKRQKITTWLVPARKRNDAYGWIKKQIKQNNSQVFVICPLIEESESETLKDVKSVKAEYEKLKEVFNSQKLGLLHGKMKEKEKNEVLGDFKDHETDILVATPVVEVGIDITNATIMVIEGSDRFGLAQLHQLRGRVGRGEKKSYCLLFAQKQTERLKAMTKTHSGFELSELDLKLRGPGEVFGLKQSGFKELKIASWMDSVLIKQSNQLAKDIIKNPKKFKKAENLLAFNQPLKVEA